MRKQIDISTWMYVFILFIIYFLGTSSLFSQDYVTADNFKNKIAKDITIVEFWAEWNQMNQFNELIKLKGCNVYRIDIMSYMDIQMNYNVTAIPTVIIFDNGVEKARFNPNVMFQLDADKKTVQHSVDTITLNKFQ
jgi:thioredoxin-related protein|tara:strand:- start:1738 stop:2145 length:408 start_codon:yes stop_codon:yes gene_type:complete